MKSRPFTTLFKKTLVTQQTVRMLSLLGLGLILMLLGSVNNAKAQADLLKVELEWPNEGETLYAGPTSLLYQIPIKGLITTQAFSPTDIEVVLTVSEGAEIIGNLQTMADANGRFEFNVTVNPQGSSEEFTIAFNDCGDDCHSPGDMDLQPGKLQLHVTATDPDGNEAHAERNITVDIAELATVPVTVLLADDSQQIVEHVNVSASTWVYLWRTRFGHGITDGTGITAVQVEALSQSPTEYVFKIDPTVVDGVLYEGVEPVTVELSPGATTAPPITLSVNAYTGAVSGQLLGMTNVAVNDLSVLAIRLPAGESYQTNPSDQGVFTFPSLPIDHYLLAVAGDPALENRMQSEPQSVDLFENREAEVEIPLMMATGSQPSRQIINDVGMALPFAWVTVEENGRSHRAALDSGTVVFNELPTDASLITVSAPGYYSQKQLVNISSNSSLDGDLILTERPETQRLSWGSGTIIVPAETRTENTDKRLFLERGWLWGESNTVEPFMIQTLTADITPLEGRFALLYLPGEQAWLYQFDGRSQIQPYNKSEPITVQSGHMINLLNEAGLQVVPYNPAIVAAMYPNTTPPIQAVWEPTLSARLRDQLAQVGINTAQIITFVTYFIVLSSLFLIPITAVYWRWKRKNTNH